MIQLRKFVLRQLVRFAERDLYDTPVASRLDDERRMKLFAALWDMPGFREYCIERETRLVHALAGKWTPEVHGQRAENSILFHKAKAAWDRQEKLAGARK